MSKSYDPTKILLEVSKAVSASLDIDTVSALVLKESRKALGADHASLFLIDEATGHLALSKADGFSDDEIENIRLLGSWETITETLINKKTPLLVNDVLKSDAVIRKKKAALPQDGLPIHSFIASPLMKDQAVIGALIVSNKARAGHLFTDEDEELLSALSNHVAIALANARLYNKLKNLFISTITSLTRAIDAKDRYTSGHSERVMKYAVAVGREMGLGEETLENIRLASILHDVGKIGVKESILMKPAKLLGYERRQVKQHPGIGARIVEGIENSQTFIRGILEHHERYDGTGYPKKLKAEAISIEGRVIAVADTFDALTTDRPYKKGLSAEAAFKVIEEASGTQFDPKVVKAFEASYAAHPDIWRL